MMTSAGRHSGEVRGPCRMCGNAQGFGVLPMSMTRMLWLALLTSSSALAIFTPEQLAKLVKSPDSFKATEKYTDSRVNSGFPVYSWKWGSIIIPDLQLQRSPSNSAAWELYLGNDAYVLPNLAPQRKLLAIVKDSLKNVTVSLYAITSGPLRGAYALDEQFSDGGGVVVVQTKAYALAAARGSEFKQDTPTKLLSYPLYGVLSARRAMCVLPEVSCK